MANYYACERNYNTGEEEQFTRAKYLCSSCGNEYSSKFALDRHTRRNHPDEDEVMSDQEEDDRIGQSEDDSSEESEEDSSEESEEDSEPDTPITRSMVNSVFNSFRDRFDELVEEAIEEGASSKDARKAAYRQLVQEYRKSFRKNMEHYIIRYQLFRKEPLYKAIMKTAKDLRDTEDFSVEESIKSDNI